MVDEAVVVEVHLEEAEEVVAGVSTGVSTVLFCFHACCRALLDVERHTSLTGIGGDRGGRGGGRGGGGPRGAPRGGGRGAPRGGRGGRGGKPGVRGGSKVVIVRIDPIHPDKRKN